MREKLPPVWQLPHFFADWCTVWRCHEIREIYSSSSLAEPIEFVVLNSLMSVHTALNWLWHISQRIIPKKYINLSLVTVVAAMDCRPLRDLSSVTLPPFLKRRTHRLTELTSLASSSHTFLSCLSVSGAFRSKKFSHHSQPRTYVRNIRHFALPLLWTHVADWSIDNPGGNGHCRHPVSKARNYPALHSKGGEYIWSYFRTEFRTSYSSSIELYKNADHSLQFSGFMNIMNRSFVGFLNGWLIVANSVYMKTLTETRNIYS